MKYLYSIALFLCMALSAGCSSIKAIDTESTSARIAVQYSVMKYIKQDQSKARRVVRHVDRTITLVNGDEALTVAQIADKVRERINWARLDAADRLLLDTLLVELQANLEGKIGAGKIDPEGQVKLITVLEWIRNAALMSG